MSGSRRTVPGSYARAVERRWARLCGRAVILSERDWALIDDWHRRGIPLQIIEEAVDAAAERRARGRGSARPPRGLAYVAPAVEEAWRTVLDGRLAAEGPPRETAGTGPGGVEAWRRRLSAEPETSALHRLLTALLQALDSGEGAEQVDARLDREIVEAAPGPLRRRAESEVAGELEAYVGRMREETLEATRLRAVARRLRAWLDLPRLERSAGD